MSVLSSFVALQRVRMRLGETPQGVNGEIAKLLDKTLQNFRLDIAEHTPKGENIVALEAWRKPPALQQNAHNVQQAEVIALYA